MSNKLLLIQLGLLVAISFSASTLLVKATDFASVGMPETFDVKYLPGPIPIHGTTKLPNIGPILKLSDLFSPREVLTKFSIYTRRGQVEEIIYNPNSYCYPDTTHGPFHYDLEALTHAGFDPKLRTIVMIPGFLTDDYPDWIMTAKDLWLQLEDVNIIMTTWKDGNRYIYSQAVVNTPVIARQISIFLYYLAKLHNTDINNQSFLDRIQLVGHSLGAHISGFVGKEFGGNLSRITGLDPAGPDFQTVSRDRRLDKSDAQLVTIIHSNRGKLDYVKAVMGGVADVEERIKERLNSFGLGSRGNPKKTNLKADDQAKQLKQADQLESITIADVLNNGVAASSDNPWFGIDEQLGDIDYYANDGAEQPGCKDFMHICDHGRSTQLYGDMLRFELSRRSKSNSKEWLKTNRLIAFGSVSFDDFLTGKNFHELCPAIYNEGQNIHDETLSQCSIPIDIYSPVEELIEEYKLYGIDFKNKLSGFNPKTKYWFVTQHESPFMGDHYLLKIDIDPEMSFWDDTCTIKAEINMASMLKAPKDDDLAKPKNSDIPPIGTIMSETRKGAGLVMHDQFHGLAIPFVNPHADSAQVALNNILARMQLAARESGSGLEPDIMRRIAKILPAEVKLSIATSNLDYVLGIDSKKDAEKCSLSIKSIEVVPMGRKKQGLAARYLEPGSGRVERGGWFDKNKNQRKSYLKNSRLLSINGNTSLVNKFVKLVVKKE